MRYLILAILIGCLSGRVLAQNVTAVQIIQQQIQNAQNQLANCNATILNELQSQINYWQSELPSIQNVDTQATAVNKVSVGL